MATPATRIRTSKAEGQVRPEELQVVTQTWLRMVLTRLAIAVVLLASLLLLALAGDFVFLFTSTHVRYFGVTPDFRVVEMKALNESVLSASGLKEWAHETVARALSLDFSNFRQQLTDVEPRFTPAAFRSFKLALQTAGILDLILHGRLVTSVTTEGAPVVVSEQLVGGVAHWQIEFPLALSYESSKGIEHTQHLMAKVLVRRVPPTESLEGVRIAQIILAPK